MSLPSLAYTKGLLLWQIMPDSRQSPQPKYEKIGYTGTLPKVRCLQKQQNNHMLKIFLCYKGWCIGHYSSKLSYIKKVTQ